MIIQKHLKILLETKESFNKIKKKSFEDSLGDYIKMLLLSGLINATFTLIYTIINATYLKIFYKIDVDYLRLLNYSLSQFTGIIFFYLFIGTFFVFILSLIIYKFFKYFKYTSFLKIIFYSLSPLLLFSWIPLSLLGLILWSIFIFIQGIKISEKDNISKNIKGTIYERE